MVNFVVIHAFSSYTGILAQPWIHAMRAMPSTLQLKVKSPTEHEIVVVRGDQSVAWQCFREAINHEIKQKKQIKSNPL